MTKKEKASKAVAILEGIYPDSICSLTSRKDYELMVAVRLSAQCTDAQVNAVTAGLFVEFPTLESFAEADMDRLTEMVRPCGFYKVKAENIRDACRMLIDEYGGKVPDDMEELLKIPGVGRKSANLLLGDLYGRPAIVADTHCIRIANRLGLCKTTDPFKVELELKKVVDPAKSNDFCHRLVLFGRETCTARRPSCGSCPMDDFCLGPDAGKKKKKS